MTAIRYTGASKATSEQHSISVGGTALISQIYTVSCPNGGSVVYVSLSTDTNTTIAAALVALLTASSFPEFQEWTFSSSLAVITAIQKTAGKPGTLTSSASGGSATLVHAVVVAASGPSFLDNLVNYSTGALPVNGDDLYFDSISIPVLYNLNALSGITLNSLNILASYTGLIGLPEQNIDGGTAYEEFRPTYAKLSSTTINVGWGAGGGLGRLKLDTGTVQTAINCWQTGGAADPAPPEVFLWKGTHAANTYNIRRGSFAAAPFGGEVATVATGNQSFVTSQDNDAQVRLGVGCTLGALSMTGGTLEVNSAFTTLTKIAGTLLIQGRGAIGTINETSGQTTMLGTGTITTYNLGAADLECPGDVAFTITTMNITAPGATINDPRGRINAGATFTIQFKPTINPNTCTIDVGPGRAVAYSGTVG